MYWYPSPTTCSVPSQVCICFLARLLRFGQGCRLYWTAVGYRIHCMYPWSDSDHLDTVSSGPFHPDKMFNTISSLRFVPPGNQFKTVTVVVDESWKIHATVWSIHVHQHSQVDLRHIHDRLRYLFGLLGKWISSHLSLDTSLANRLDSAGLISQAPVSQPRKLFQDHGVLIVYANREYKFGWGSLLMLRQGSWTARYNLLFSTAFIAWQSTVVRPSATTTSLFLPPALPIPRRNSGSHKYAMMH